MSCQERSSVQQILGIHIFAMKTISHHFAHMNGEHSTQVHVSLRTYWLVLLQLGIQDDR